jgi:hypothetical protein
MTNQRSAVEGSTKKTTSIFFVWWYSEAYAGFFVFLEHFFAYITDLFSAKICLKTLFAPWKRDKISYEGLSLQQQFQVWILNLTSRFVGAIIKIFTLFTYLVVLAICTAIGAAIAIIWLLYPLIIVALIYFGIKLIFS